MKKLIIPGLWVIIVVFSQNTWACTSDFGCGVGYTCVKEPLRTEGICMKTVDEYGTREYNLPNVDSIGPNMDLDGQCDYDTDCPIGFKCARKLKVCVKR